MRSTDPLLTWRKQRIWTRNLSSIHQRRKWPIRTRAPPNSNPNTWYPCLRAPVQLSSVFCSLLRLLPGYQSTIRSVIEDAKSSERSGRIIYWMEGKSRSRCLLEGKNRFTFAGDICTWLSLTGTPIKVLAGRITKERAHR